MYINLLHIYKYMIKKELVKICVFQGVRPKPSYLCSGLALVGLGTSAPPGGKKAGSNPFELLEGGQILSLNP